MLYNGGKSHFDFDGSFSGGFGGESGRYSEYRQKNSTLSIGQIIIMVRVNRKIVYEARFK